VTKIFNAFLITHACCTPTKFRKWIWFWGEYAYFSLALMLSRYLHP
jgi:hypothetical protein